MEYNNLNNKKLKDNPFIVPDGYFSEMQKNVMSKIEGQEPVKAIKVASRHQFLQPLLMAAASVCVAVVGVTAYLHYINMDTQQDDMDIQMQYSMYDDDSDYITMDNEDIYSYMSEY